VPRGKGIGDYRRFIGALRDIGYQGFITDEMCEVLGGAGSIENLDRTARQFLTYIKQFDSPVLAQ
jgi:sugar phosphate isomerase/epimerase